MEQWSNALSLLGCNSKDRAFGSARPLFFLLLSECTSSKLERKDVSRKKEQAVPPREKKGGTKKEGESGDAKLRKWNGYEKWFGSFRRRRLNG